MNKNNSAFECGQEVAKDLFDALNWMSMEKEVIQGFMNQVQSTHRTLQQNFGGLLIAAIKHFAEMYDKGWYDARNEALCKMCKAMQSTVNTAHLPFI